MRKWTDEELIRAVETSDTISHVAKKLNLAISGGTYVGLQKHMRRLGCSFPLSPRERKLFGFKQHQYKNRHTDGVTFCADSVVSQSFLKKRYLQIRTMSYKCDLCEIFTWNNKILALHLDHINGSRRDNRIENLRLLCPNCHSLTPTFGSKNKV